MNTGNHGCVGGLRQTGEIMRIICNADNSQLPLAFGSLEAAGALIAGTAGPAVWIIANQGSAVPAGEVGR